ncbi:hypothetical protein F511_30520 [Dorcoceras hygrometricum]|uniref:Uncharacterized protein n=1 Tax=Dorcoceras hygrometricum TaxID=472368 RepID=A0A2Z7D1I4_9LAMI|nr:hypothetical protein F511_30520 [Dorcoceras hygrometricum]
MASFIFNALQVNFESVLSMEDAGMVKMFRRLEQSGLRGFLGAFRSVFEATLNQFFVNASVIAGTVVSTLENRKMVITLTIFVEMFHHPTEGLVNFSGLPAQAVADMKLLFSTQYCGEVILSILLKKLVKADLGESVTLHPLKVFNNKSVLTYMKKNQVAPQASEPKKEQVEQLLAPSDSESTVSLSLPEIKKKQRTKRPKLVKPISAKEVKAVSKDLHPQVHVTELKFSKGCDAINEERSKSINLAKAMTKDTRWDRAGAGGRQRLNQLW